MTGAERRIPALGQAGIVMRSGPFVARRLFVNYLWLVLICATPWGERELFGVSERRLARYLLQVFFGGSGPSFRSVLRLRFMNGLADHYELPGTYAYYRRRGLPFARSLHSAFRPLAP